MRENNTVVVVGAGAMGGVFGARLTEAGVGTVLVDANAELVERINASGITLIEPDSERTIEVAATTDAASLEPPDAVIFFVKCHHTEAAVESAAPLLVDGTRAVTLQNGWGNADILAACLRRGADCRRGHLYLGHYHRARGHKHFRASQDRRRAARWE